jgi:bifunctional oligoribonuclease and PAP phosphatase NrnA
MIGTPTHASGPEPADTHELERLLARGIATDQAEAAWHLIAPAARVVLLAHEHPDPDTLGSALGLARVLRTLGKQCVVACADPPPATYAAFLPEVETVVTALPDTAFDLVIALDAGELARYGALYERHRAFFDSATILNFDHHVTSRGCGQVNLIDVASAATAELLTLFLLNRRLPIDRETAICLLAGIITDTRAFEFDATTARTLAAGAYLVSRGAVPQDIIKPVYRMKPLAKARLWGLALATLGSALGGLLIWAEISQAMLAEAGALADMDDGLPSYLIDIDGAGVAILLKEQPDGTTRVSIRTAAPYDAAALAAHFGGGGHVRAAGCSLPLDLERAKAALLDYAQVMLGAAHGNGDAGAP